MFFVGNKNKMYTFYNNKASHKLWCE